ncbi:hypothetical protein HPB48_008275 [Haemaphysalis longicornis]|uniref:2',3'-cyclic-nucleotide 3'-phosphodiesterase n=1 Tax=Haemaphysalis longicornis TaxID=44386 RepID=A0A9J6GPA0_HAELO|nr:hypothetical protein HPB48_008275 [Haemaphysalis longicornis]
MVTPLRTNYILMGAGKLNTEAPRTLPQHHADVLELLKVPYLKEEDTVAFLRTHRRLLFLVRGPPASGKKAVRKAIEMLYPGSQVYHANMFFKGDAIPGWNSDTRGQAHEICRNKINEFMTDDVPFIININTNVEVWEVNPFLEMAARHSYTVILVNMPHHFIMTAETLAEVTTARTKSYTLDKKYLSRRLREWEEVHPYAMGWSPRLTDAAELLNRFRKIRAALQKLDPGMVPKDAVSILATPFALARICLFGRTKADKEYCESQKVREACGRKDTLTVFGYAVSEGFVYALVTLTEAQVSLAEGPNDGSNRQSAADKGDDLPELRAATLSISDDWKEVRSEVDLGKLTTRILSTV